MHHPNNVKRYRQERGLSAEALAHRSDICLSTLYKVERGGECADRTKKAILRGLGISLAFLTEIFPDGDDRPEEEKLRENLQVL